MNSRIYSSIEKICKILGNVWIFTGAALIVVGHIAYILNSDSPIQGILDVMNEMNPFNIPYYFSVFLILSPGVLLLWIASKINQSKAKKFN